MQIEFPPAIASYLAADRANDVDALVACFTPDAWVHDEQHDYRGSEAIRSWKKSTMAKFTYTIEPLSLTRAGDVATLHAKLTGNFPGSPVTLNFKFTLAGDRIAALDIG